MSSLALTRYASGVTSLVHLGWSRFAPDQPPPPDAARLRSHHRIAWDAWFADGSEARVTAPEGIEPRPVVGDWVRLEGRTIATVLPRRTVLRRRAAGLEQKEQVLVANADVVFLVMAVDRDFNLRRLERLLVIARDGGAAPVVVLTKADVVADVERYVQDARDLAGVPVHAVSAEHGMGLAELDAYFQGDATVALLGSSGVGKSTLANALLGMDEGGQRVAHVRRDGKGRHTTARRDLFLRPGGGLVVDTPGMREVGLWDAEDGLADTFEDVESLVGQCRFRDCTHGSEPGCAVQAAVASGALGAARVERWRAFHEELAQTRDPGRVAAERKAGAKRISRAAAALFRDRNRKGGKA
jgi:ribosome biogenesis GTPase